MQYRVIVFTGNKKRAGTDATVQINMHGTKASSGVKTLDNAEDNHERGKVDRYIIDCRKLGDIKSIQVWHDNSKKKPGWFLDKIIVEKISSGRTWTFPCGEWLALTTEPYSISRLLTPSGSQGNG
jgi:hypothetical protein